MSSPEDQPITETCGAANRPQLETESTEAASWVGLQTMIGEGDLDAFSQWLDESLIELERDLEEFVTTGSRYSGRS